MHSSICSSYMYIGKLKRINVSNFLILNWKWDIFFANRILRQIVFFIAFFFWIWLLFSIFFKNARSYCFSMLTIWAFLWSIAISFNLTEQDWSSQAFYHFLCDEIWCKSMSSLEKYTVIDINVHCVRPSHFRHFLYVLTMVLELCRQYWWIFHSSAFQNGNKKVAQRKNLGPIVIKGCSLQVFPNAFLLNYNPDI